MAASTHIAEPMISDIAGIIGVSRTRQDLQLPVIPRALVFIFDEDGQRGPGGAGCPVLFQKPGQQAGAVAFHPSGRSGVPAGRTAGHLHPDLLQIEGPPAGRPSITQPMAGPWLSPEDGEAQTGTVSRRHGHLLHPLIIRKKRRPAFLYALGACDFDRFLAHQGGHRHAHDDAVILVAGNPSPSQSGPALQNQAVRPFLHLGTETAQAVRRGGQPVALLEPETGGAGDMGFSLGDGGGDGEDGNQVGNLGGVDFHPVQGVRRQWTISWDICISAPIRRRIASTARSPWLESSCSPPPQKTPPPPL